MHNYQGKCLLIPSKPDVERDAVAKVWEDHGGIVMRLERFWETIDLENRIPILYGNHIFCLVIAQKMNLELVSPSDDFLIQLHERWIKRVITRSTIEDASYLIYPCFIKPMIPKTFTGKVYYSYMELLEECMQLSDNTEIIYSDIVQIKAEVRTFILNNKVASASIYEGDADINEAILFVNKFLSENIYITPLTYVLDVGLLDNGEWAVIEANPVWSAGLNGCDAGAAASCINEATKTLQVINGITINN
jgi:hypothetical protein